MSTLTFDGTHWQKKPERFSFDEVVVLKNSSNETCHITFSPKETFGIESIGLAAGSRIALPFQQRMECTVDRGGETGTIP